MKIHPIGDLEREIEAPEPMIETPTPIEPEVTVPETKENEEFTF
jgi:hypothetical protein